MNAIKTIKTANDLNPGDTFRIVGKSFAPMPGGDTSRTVRFVDMGRDGKSLSIETTYCGETYSVDFDAEVEIDG